MEKYLVYTTYKPRVLNFCSWKSDIKKYKWHCRSDFIVTTFGILPKSLGGDRDLQMIDLLRHLVNAGKVEDRYHDVLETLICEELPLFLQRTLNTAIWLTRECTLHAGLGLQLARDRKWRRSGKSLSKKHLRHNLQLLF